MVGITQSEVFFLAYRSWIIFMLFRFLFSRFMHTDRGLKKNRSLSLSLCLSFSFFLFFFCRYVFVSFCLNFSFFVCHFVFVSFFRLCLSGPLPSLVVLLQFLQWYNNLRMFSKSCNNLITNKFNVDKMRRTRKVITIHTFLFPSLILGTSFI